MEIIPEAERIPLDLVETVLGELELQLVEQEVINTFSNSPYQKILELSKIEKKWKKELFFFILITVLLCVTHCHCNRLIKSERSEWILLKCNMLFQHFWQKFSVKFTVWKSHSIFYHIKMVWEYFLSSTVPIYFKRILYYRCQLWGNNWVSREMVWF